jgi:hypothetical protein
VAQLLAGGDAHPVHAQPIAPGIEDHVGISIAVGGIEPAEYVIELQTAGKLHTNSSRTIENLQFFCATGPLENKDHCKTSKDSHKRWPKKRLFGGRREILVQIKIQDRRNTLCISRACIAELGQKIRRSANQLF